MALLQHLKYGKFAPRILSNKGRTPLYLIFFATSYCNLKCEHCFYWKELNVKRDELNLEEIEKIAKNMDDLLFLRLTGGEPTLRKDLPEIVKIFYDNNNLRNVGISTAGFLTKRVLSHAERILELCPGLELEFCISIDDTERFHDLNRGIPNTYKNAEATIKGLKEIRERHDRIRINVGLCVTKGNQDRLDEIFENALVPLGVDTIQVNIIRGDPKNPGLMEVDLEKYQNLLKKTRAYNSTRGYHGLYISSNVKDKLMSSIIVKTIKERKFQGIYCNAGNKIGVLYSDGNLFPCELLEDKKIGNLRDSNYDFRSLWNSPRALEVRNFIHDTKCFCTHECFLTTNLLLDPKNLVGYMKNYASSKISDADISREKNEVEHLVKIKMPNDRPTD
jgi:MoaA/NifB/PqqE/SkfB family radical SAM enzyme